MNEPDKPSNLETPKETFPNNQFDAKDFVNKNKKVLIIIFIVLIILILLFLYNKNKCIDPPGNGNLGENCGKSCDKVCNAGYACTGGTCKCDAKIGCNSTKPGCIKQCSDGQTCQADGTCRCVPNTIEPGESCSGCTNRIDPCVTGYDCYMGECYPSCPFNVQGIGTSCVNCPYACKFLTAKCWNNAQCVALNDGTESNPPYPDGTCDPGLSEVGGVCTASIY